MIGLLVVLMGASFGCVLVVVCWLRICGWWIVVLVFSGRFVVLLLC